MARGGYPSDKQDQYMLRFPDGMRDRLKEEAAKNNRSMNAEIIARLEASFSGSPQDQKELIEQVIDTAIKTMIEKGWRKIY